MNVSILRRLVCVALLMRQYLRRRQQQQPHSEVQQHMNRRAAAMGSFMVPVESPQTETATFMWRTPTTARFRSSITAAGMSASSRIMEPASGSSALCGASAVDGSSNVYAADSFNSRVQKFSSSGIYLAQFGTVGTGNGQFGPNSPTGVTVDKDGNVYATDNDNGRVQKFDSNGNFLLASVQAAAVCSVIRSASRQIKAAMFMWRTSPTAFKSSTVAAISS